MVGDAPQPTSKTLSHPDNALRKASLTTISAGSDFCLNNSSVRVVPLFIKSCSPEVYLPARNLPTNFSRQ
jgi:hypothetical protein